MSIRTRLLPLFVLAIASAFEAAPVQADGPRARAAAPAARSEAPGSLVDLNTASQAELERLPGIGPSKAAAIVRHREGRPFQRVEDLLRVRGIGRATFQQLRPMVTVSTTGSSRRR
jgi:competence protein ComEA